MTTHKPIDMQGLHQGPPDQGPEQVFRSAPVTIKLLEGERLKGQLMHLNGPNQEIILKTIDSRLHRLPTSDIKYILFMRPVKPEVAQAAGAGAENEYHIVFENGEVMQGKTSGSVLDEEGLHLFRQASENSLLRVFVPYAAIRDYQIGPKLGQLLLDAKVITPSQLSDSLAKQQQEREQEPAPPEREDPLQAELERVLNLHKHKEGHRRLGEIMQEVGGINPKALYEALAKKFGMQFSSLREIQIDPESINYIPRELARKHRLMPLRIEGERLHIAVEDPTDVEALNTARFVSGHAIHAVVATQDDIDWAIGRFYSLISAEEAVADIQQVSDGRGEELSAQEAERIGSEKPIVRLIHNIIVDAISRKASDIHLRPEDDYIELIYRIDGTLIMIRRFDKVLLPAMVSRIKIIGRMNIAERRLPQDGRAKYMTDESMVDLRISIMPTVSGESVVIRILNVQVGLKTIDELGLNAIDQSQMRDILHKSYGMFLVTGPTGSGKSTTLYAALQEIIKQNVNIITVEDPVEYHIEHIEQIQINPSTGYSFARALRNILRHDPDVIMIGEIRDEETAKIAVESALTGHLVLSTLHTNDAAGAISRLLEIGVEPYLIDSTLLGVMAQRLVRRNCEYCLQEEKIEPYMRDALGISEDEVFYRGTGCEHCNNTGYHGRLAVYELLVITDEIKRAIGEHAAAVDIMKVAIEGGMTPLTQSALATARRRVTSLAEAYRVRLE